MFYTTVSHLYMKYSLVPLHQLKRGRNCRTTAVGTKKVVPRNRWEFTEGGTCVGRWWCGGEEGESKVGSLTLCIKCHSEITSLH